MKAPGTDDPVVHYVRNSSGGPDYPRICRNAIVAGPGMFTDQRDLAVFDPSGIRHYQDVGYYSDPAGPRGGTWHHRAWCPAPGKDAPARQALARETSGRPEHAATSWVTAQVCLGDGDEAVTGRGLGLGLPGAGPDPEFVQAVRTATAADPIWIMAGEIPVAVIIPAEEYHPPGTCCCKNCPWGGNHEEKNHATA